MTATTDPSRLENTTAILPIAYGSIAFYLGPQSDEYHTHKWTLYLRSPDPNFDLGKAISKVVFQLHPSFSVPTRELTEPPFEVTESGWGEFEASIRIVWRDVAEERSTILTHGIKLYPNRAAPSADPASYMNTTVPVVSEKYDEVVFTNPKIEFHNMLLSADKGKIEYPLSKEEANLEFFRIYGDEEDVQRMLAAKQFLDGELRNVKDRLAKADKELEEIKTGLTLIKDAAGESAKPAAATADAKTPANAADNKAIGAKTSENKSKAKKKASTSGEQSAAKKAKIEPAKKVDSTKKVDPTKKSDPAKSTNADSIKKFEPVKSAPTAPPKSTAPTAPAKSTAAHSAPPKQS